MKPVFQTIVVGQIDGVPGNCLQASVASLFELPIEAVPHFILYDDWISVFSKFIKQKGYDFNGTRDFTHIKEWQGVPFHGVGGYAIVCGKSVRGFDHSVIYMGDQYAHDPHPSQAGIISPDYFFVIEQSYKSTIQ